MLTLQKLWKKFWKKYLEYESQIQHIPGGTFSPPPGKLDLIQPLNISLFHFYIKERTFNRNMPVLIKDKSESGAGSSVVSYFPFYYFICRLGFISFLVLFYSKELKEYLLPGDCYIFFPCVYACYGKTKTKTIKNTILHF